MCVYDACICSGCVWMCYDVCTGFVGVCMCVQCMCMWCMRVSLKVHMLILTWRDARNLSSFLP